MPIQAPQWTDYLNCPVCCREFGAPPRSPISLSCGHTICKHCLVHLHRRQCPFDQTSIQADSEELVVNTALLQLAGYTPPAQPYHPPSIQALSEQDRFAYDVTVRRLEDLATYLKYCGNANTSAAGGRLSRPMQRKLVTLVQCAISDEEGRGRAARAARSLAERTVTELILQHQNPPQLSANLWAAVRARGCQFLGPAMQEEVLKLVLLALEDGYALSRKVLVMFVVQRLEPHFPQASKTSIGHVVQLLYRASCFKVSKRESDSSLMQLKEEFRTYESLRREHDAQIVQIATEAGLRIAPDLWSALLYGDTAHKSHMQSIIDKLQTPQSFAQSVQELFIALQRTGDPAQLVLQGRHFDRLSSIDASPDAGPPSWHQLGEILTSLKEVVSGLINYLQLQATGRDNNHNQKPSSHLTDRPTEPSTSQSSPQSGTTPTHGKYKVSMCRDAASKSYCPRGSACTFAHSEEELERYRMKVRKIPTPAPVFPGLPVITLPSQPLTYFSNLNIIPMPCLPSTSSEYPEGVNMNYPPPSMPHEQLPNGMGLNHNGAMPMMVDVAPVHIVPDTSIPPPPLPYVPLPMPQPSTSQNYQGYQNQGAHGAAPFTPPGLSMPHQGIQNQAFQNHVLQNQAMANHAMSNHPMSNQALQNQVMQGAMMANNMYVPIQSECNIPSRELSPMAFDDLQSDILSDSYRAVVNGRFGHSSRAPSSSLYLTKEDVLNFNNHGAAGLPQGHNEVFRGNMEGGYSGPKDVGYSVPMNESYSGPKDVGYSVPMNESYSGPKDVGYSVPMNESYSGPKDVGYSVPMNESYSGPMDVRYSVPMNESYSGPMDVRYSVPMNESYSGPMDVRYSVPTRVDHSIPTGVGYSVQTDVGYSVPTGVGYSVATSVGYSVPTGVGYLAPVANSNTDDSPDLDLEEEIQALERRLDKELDTKCMN